MKSLKSLQQFDKVIIIIEENIIMEENMIVIRDPKTFCFNFDWPKYVDKNLKNKIDFSQKSHESLAENKIKK